MLIEQSKNNYDGGTKRKMGGERFCEKQMKRERKAIKEKRKKEGRMKRKRDR